VGILGHSLGTFGLLQFFLACSSYFHPSIITPFSRLRKIHAPALGGCENTSHMWYGYTWARLVCQFFLACSYFHPSIITFSRPSAPFYWISLILNLLMRISCVVMVVSIAFTVVGGVFIFLGVIIDRPNLLYAGMVFCVVGGISLCCQCANRSSLNMPLVLVYQ
jgi:hypothetical protein